jgi:hypothetical protein
MFLFTVLVITLIILIAVIAAVTGVIGAGAIILFGDVIICGILIVWLIKKLFFKRRK